MMIPRLTLLAVAVLAGIGWRLEVDWRGWGGVYWVSYFHWAVPAGAILFAAWLGVYGGAQRRVQLAVGSLIVAGVAYTVLFWSLIALFSRWMPARLDIWLALGLGGGTFWLYPIALWVLGRRCGAPIRVWPCALALALWGVAVPLAIAVLHMVAHIGGADFLHAIKSGVVIPPLLVALGLPFVWSERPDRPEAVSTP